MTWYKYPKTMHLPWSPGLQNDDRLIQSLEGFEGKEVIVTEKMDGENASLYRGHYHARSLDSKHHPSRDWIKAFHGQIRHHIPEGWRVCGENLYAKHSIFYDDLPSYFMGFSIWDENNVCLDWDITEACFEEWGITPVPILTKREWDEDFIRSLFIVAGEGYVVRTGHGFHYNDFHRYVAKYVRKDHIQTDEHWMAGPVIPNKVRR